MSPRNVLITGASRGIGAATAHAFAAAGDRVAVHYGAGREQADAVCAALPGDGHLVAGADLADAEAVRAMAENVAGALGSMTCWSTTRACLWPIRLRPVRMSSGSVLGATPSTSISSDRPT
jgi:3-oxoacyl-[acyl-carrier protein] reductase